MPSNAPAAPSDSRLASLRIDPERRKAPSGGRGGIVLFLVGAAAGFAAGYFLSPKPSVAETKAPASASAPAPAAPTAPAAKKRDAGDVMLTATGYVTPRRRISLSPQVMGQVVWVGVEKGDAVEKDQILVRLDDAQYRARLKQAEAQSAAAKSRLAELEAGTRAEDIARAEAEIRELEALHTQARKNLDRIRVNVQSGAESKQRLDDAEAAFASMVERLAASNAQLARLKAGPRAEEIAAARADYEAAEAAAELARIQLDETVIKAPQKGTILEKLVEVGELVTPQSFGGTRGARTELLSLADLAELQVEVDISESDFQKIRMKHPAKVRLDAYPDRAYDAAIREIAPEADRQKATVQVKVAIAAPDKFVLPEMSARVDFLGGGEP